MEIKKAKWFSLGRISTAARSTRSQVVCFFLVVFVFLFFLLSYFIFNFPPLPACNIDQDVAAHHTPARHTPPSPPRSQHAKALGMVDGQPQQPLQLLLGRVVGQQNHIEACVRRRLWRRLSRMKEKKKRRGKLKIENEGNVKGMIKNPQKGSKRNEKWSPERRKRKTKKKAEPQMGTPKERIVILNRRK